MIAALATLLRKIGQDRSGLAITEFALTLPFLLGVGLVGLETANRVLVEMQISQLAMQVADNASRIGERATLQSSKVYEEQINDILRGAELQAGPSTDLAQHGRIIISSLEKWQNAVHSSGTPQSDGSQFIHWQRCHGLLARDSLYGKQNENMGVGMGPVGQEVTASVNTPVIYVEIFYDYQPIIAFDLFSEEEIYASAVFIVRDDRDQSKVYKRNSITQPSDCQSNTSSSDTTAT